MNWRNRKVLNGGNEKILDGEGDRDKAGWREILE